MELHTMIIAIISMIFALVIGLTTFNIMQNYNATPEETYNKLYKHCVNIAISWQNPISDCNDIINPNQNI